MATQPTTVDFTKGMVIGLLLGVVMMLFTDSAVWIGVGLAMGIALSLAFGTAGAGKGSDT